MMVMSRHVDKARMFAGASSFNQYLGKWNVELVTDFTEVFDFCSSRLHHKILYHTI